MDFFFVCWVGFVYFVDVGGYGYVCGRVCCILAVFVWFGFVGGCYWVGD